ncbi:MAG: aminoacyl-tRNA hydrolase, partial [Oscillospiraceae bacterium]
MFLIVGLGNPGMQYENTRHNAGFLAINKISKKYNCDISKLKFKGLFGKCEIENFQCILLKPQTYMNKSG